MSGLSRNRRPTEQSAIAGLGREEISKSFAKEFGPLAQTFGLGVQRDMGVDMNATLERDGPT